MRLRGLILVLIFVSCTLAASATPITYSETFVATGKLDGTNFTNALVTLAFTGDTSNVSVTNAGGYDVSLITGTGDTTVKVAGVGSDNVTDDIEVYVYGAYDPTPLVVMGADNYDPNEKGSLDVSVLNNTFGTYTLQSVLSSVTSTKASVGSGFLDTSGGKLTISKIATTPATFAASTPPVAVTPEPSSLLLLCTGMAAMGGVLRRKPSKA